MRPIFSKAGSKLPEKIRVAVGFPSYGSKGDRIGECWYPTASADHHTEILIRPDREAPRDIAAIVTHELVHAAVGAVAGHGPIFRGLAVGLGLEGKMTATEGGPDFHKMVDPILRRLGPFPHARLNFSGRAADQPKKQGTRLLKLECPECGYLIRTTSKWIDTMGFPTCPCGEEFVNAGDLED
jgi:hypothetical protein